MKQVQNDKTNDQDHGGRETDPQLKTTDDEPSRASDSSFSSGVMRICYMSGELQSVPNVETMYTLTTYGESDNITQELGTCPYYLTSPDGLFNEDVKRDIKEYLENGNTVVLRKRRLIPS